MPFDPTDPLASGDERMPRPLERPHGWRQQGATVVPYRNAAKIDPLPSAAVRNDPVLMARHEAQVRDMLLALIPCWRPDLARHPRLKGVAGSLAALIETTRSQISKLPDNDARWAVVLSVLTSMLDADTHERRTRTKRTRTKG